MHLSQKNGGFGWAHPRLIAPAASTGRVLDVLYLMRRLEDVSPLLPPPRRREKRLPRRQLEPGALRYFLVGRRRRHPYRR